MSYLFFWQTPLKEQLGPEQSSVDFLEQMCSKDIASHLTNYDWELFMAMHEVKTSQHLLYLAMLPQLWINTFSLNLWRNLKSKQMVYVTYLHCWLSHLKVLGYTEGQKTSLLVIVFKTNSVFFLAYHLCIDYIN